MQFYPFTIPEFARYLFPSLSWKMDNLSKKEIYLTFDDGPQSAVTPWVLKTLKEFNAKGTFFVVGENAEKHPQIMADIQEGGHSLGNHTHKHLSGYSSGLDTYLADILQCQKLTRTNLFRPPYGRIKNSQIRALKEHYQLIMWNQLSGDFDKRLNRKKSLASLCLNAKEGNIVVFHDSQKSFENLKEILPQFLEYLQKHEFICSPIPYNEYLVD